MAIWILSNDWKFEIYSGFIFRPWRLLLLTYCIPGIFGAFWLLRLRESPRFLLTIRRDEEALEIVNWIYCLNKKKPNANDFQLDGLKPELNESSSNVGKGL